MTDDRSMNSLSFGAISFAVEALNHDLAAGTAAAQSALAGPGRSFGRVPVSRAEGRSAAELSELA